MDPGIFQTKIRVKAEVELRLIRFHLQLFLYHSAYIMK